MSNDNNLIPFDCIAERHLILQKSTADPRLEVTIRIGRPTWAPDGNHAICPVEIVGLGGRMRDIAGVDPIDALTLALRFVDSMLDQHLRNRELFWPDGELFCSP